MDKAELVSKKRRFLSGYLAGFFGVFVIAVLVTFLWITGGIAEPFGTDKVAEDMTVTIVEGTGMLGVIADLKDAGLIENPFFAFGLQVYVILNDLDTKLQFGTYGVSPTDTLVTLITKISGGDAADTSVRVTFPEGLTRSQILAVFEDKGFAIDGQVIDSLESVLRAEYEFLGRTEQDVFLEGYLFPDTYKFDPRADARTLLTQVLNNTARRLQEALGERATQSDLYDVPILSRGISLHELITLASLVEREVDVDEDRPIVAGIMLNRLERGFPLQLDATVNYITGKSDAGVLVADTQIDSPYNTYKYAGLPIGPISNPGLKSIEAVLKAQDTPYFYYLHGLDGQIYYATTFEEHTANKQKYR